MKLLLFDLDDTLYPATLGVVARIDRRINEYLAARLSIPAADVDGMRRRFWRDHGTTLRGLMERYHVDPDDYLAYVHDLDLSDLLGPDSRLGEMLDRLPQRKAVFTNASRRHARNVLDLLGITDRFEAVLGLEDHRYVPKPFPEAYQGVLARLGASGRDCVFVEDSLKNLAPARTLGMRTVWVAGPKREPGEVDHVIATVHELESVLEGIA